MMSPLSDVNCQKEQRDSRCMIYDIIDVFFSYCKIGR